MTKTYIIYVKDMKNRRDNMTSEEVESLSRKLAYLEKINPLKFENFKGRLEALYEILIDTSLLNGSVSLLTDLY